MPSPLHFKPAANATPEMNQNQQPQELASRITRLYLEFVSLNPTLQNYVTTVGFRTGLRTDEELLGFCERIYAPRSSFAINNQALTHLLANTFIPN